MWRVRRKQKKKNTKNREAENSCQYMIPRHRCKASEHRDKDMRKNQAKEKRPPCHPPPVNTDP